MERVGLNRVGSIETFGVEALSEFHGRDFLPHPFAHTRPSPFADYDAYRGYAAAMLDRINHSEYNGIQQWFATYVNADLRVECTIDRRDAPRVRLVAHRSGPLGYLATQKPDDDVIEVYSVSPLELGAALAGWSALTRPGSHSKLNIPEYAPDPPRLADSDGDTVGIRHKVETSDVKVAPRSHAVVLGRVQSHWRPAREWGFDRHTRGVVWVRIEGDGEYIYTPDYSHLTPLTTRNLATRIDELIAADVQAVRESRDGYRDRS
ncbi:ESX secretion-associated protein EspG [Mycobacteroides salmoniphilum]|uniref:ESX secretion-associated protein EspG n=1 Tax=Mycobacteroides salmoniphilum TaxID=404941 RepID=UPI000993E09C|nr:ESX secretion-associated protein EspG [Mycobacteroides salmoniphilum]QCH25763.1 hypothetical protein DSM43276_04049 [Mycobacteroides salmoniphilum]